MINNNQMVRAIGIDVHKDSCSISAFDPQTTNFSAETTVAFILVGLFRKMGYKYL